MALCVVTILSTACAKTVSNPTLPPLKAYSEEFSNQLADELAGPLKGTACDTAIGDYRLLRTIIKCSKDKKQCPK